jgi:hypothetical protein
VTDRPVTGGALCRGSRGSTEGVVRRSGADMPVVRWRTWDCSERPAAPPRRTISDYLSTLASVKGKSQRRCPILINRCFELRMSNKLWRLASLPSGAKLQPERGRLRIRGPTTSRGTLPLGTQASRDHGIRLTSSASLVGDSTGPARRGQEGRAAGPPRRLRSTSSFSRADFRRKKSPISSSMMDFITTMVRRSGATTAKPC